VRQIDGQLRRSMAMAAQAAFTQGTDAREAMEQVRAANLALQQERKQLIAEHFAPDFLDEEPICSHCGGEGYIGTRMCSCLQALCCQEQKKELSLLAAPEQRFANFRADYYPEQLDPQYGASPRMIMERNFQVCRKYAESFGTGSGNLLFVGGTGLGKTFLSACIAAEVAEKGISVAYEPASHLFSKLEKARFEPSEENRAAADRLNTCELLIIDDLGTELPGQFVTAALYTLVNDRLLAGLPMVISTNLNVDEIARRYSPQIASRLQGSFQRLTFVGKDIRVLKNRGI
jgi:DNA replication protein DnaC